MDAYVGCNNVVQHQCIGSDRWTGIYWEKELCNDTKALASVKNGQAVKIQKDVIINSSVRMKRNVKFTLDLNNHTVKKIQYDGGLFNSKIGDFDLAKGQMNVKNGTLDAWVTVQKGATLYNLRRKTLAILF